MDPVPPPLPGRSAQASRLLLGLLFVAGGLLFTLANFGLVDAQNVWRYWPLILVGVGLLKLMSRSVFPGLILIGLGVLFQLRELGVVWFRLSMLFPLILVVVGLRILTGGFRGRWPAQAQALPGGVVNEWAVFGGGDRRISSEFAGGQANALFGGFNLDLRNSTMVGDTAAVDVFCFCGGGEIRIPEGWNVVMSVTAIFGGTDDKTRHDFAPSTESARKRLVVRGFILFGGLGVKN